jgi:hypothetical protein
MAVSAEVSSHPGLAQDLLGGARIQLRPIGASLGNPPERFPTSLARHGSPQSLESFADRNGDRRRDALARSRSKFTRETVGSLVLAVQRHGEGRNISDFLPGGGALCATFAKRSRSLSTPSATVRARPITQEVPMRSSHKIVPLAVAVAVVVAGVAAAPAAAAPATALREFEGTVVSVNRDARTFRLRDSERGTVRIHVNRLTRYERIAGLGGLERGMRNIEATVRRSDGRWVAREVERSGGGGEHGGDDD